MLYSKYLVKDTDRFVPARFPQVEDDLGSLIVAMAALPSALNTEMLISFCKDHCMQSEWVRTNPVLAELISSKSLPIANLEALFAACSTHAAFRGQLEAYITGRFGTASLSAAS
jgi:hypothetical protein